MHQIILSVISLKYQRFRHLIEGEPAILVNAGKIDEKKMRKQRYNIDDLMMQLKGTRSWRYSGCRICYFGTVWEVICLSKTKNKQDTLQFTLPLIIDGEIQSSHLQMIEHTDAWLIEKLKT